MQVNFAGMTRWMAQASLAASMVIGVNAAAHAQDSTTQVAETAAAQTSGYQGVSRAWLWGPLNEMVDTTKFKKDPPYVIGFSNASISNAWRVAFQHSIEYAVAQNKDKIKKFIITDANDDPAKQISDIQDLLNQGVDLLLVAASTEDALDSVVGRATKEGVPVVMVDRRVKT
ncbi:MAG: substrate-binding domain-containing protein, partial [Dongiaceae bacterium]